MSTEFPPALGTAATVAPDRIRYRATWTQRLPLIGAFLFLVVIEFSNRLVWSSGHGTYGLATMARVVAFGTLAVVLFEMWLVGWWFGVTLTGQAAVVHNLRRRVIPWNRVAAVQVERFFRGQRIVMYEIDGRRTPLRAPIVSIFAYDLGRDRGFAQKAAFIGHWWLTHRAG